MMREYGGGEEERVSEWEVGLPSSGDLTPLCHRLISPELASAFSISPEAHRTTTDVHRASQDTLSGLRNKHPLETTDHNNNKDDDDAADDVAERNPKRARLVWTSQLHKRFVEVVAHLGIKNAVPKTIMQMMNVEGLTRENVASHLQKYRLYLKRMQGLSDEGPSSSDHLFASNPIPHNSESGHVAMHVTMMPGHGAYPWMREASGNYKFESVGSYHHRLAGFNDK